MKKFSFLFVIAFMAGLILGSDAFGQITLRGSSTNNSTGTSISVAMPVGVVQNDVMIAVIAKQGNTADATAPAGWTLIDGANLAGGTARNGTVFYKVAGPGEAGPYSFTLGAGTTHAGATIVAFAGVNSSNPFDVAPGTIQVNASSATVTAAAITNTTSGAAIVMCGMLAGSNRTYSGWTTTSPGALTEIAEDGTGDVNDGARAGAAWALKATVSSTGNGTATLSAAERNGGILLALRPAPAFIVNAGLDQLVAGTTVTLSGSTTAGGSPTYAWTKTSGPAGETIVTPSSPATSVTGLSQGTYVFRLTVNGTLFDEVTVRVITGSNLWATSSDGNQISSYTVSNGSYISGPTNMFAPLGGSTAALGRNDKPTATSGYFYWLPNDGTNGVVNLYAATAAGNDRTLIATFDVNGGSNNSLGYVRLGMGPDGRGWILARESTTNTIYLAKFTSNGLNPVTVTVEDASVLLTGGVNADFVNGDICVDAGGRLFALANNGSGVTQIFIGSPNGASTNLVKKWDLVDPSNVPFTGTVNGVAFDLLGALYISTGTGLFYINPATVNGPAGTVQCSLVQLQTGLQDLASNVFPNTILLPIKLGSFTVTKQGTNALLNWTTASEINTDHFEIERSYDGVNFVSVGTKQAAGNSFTDVQYSFADPITISSGIIYYRLKTLDIDSKESYSKIVPLRLNGGVVKGFNIYPNPFSSDLKIEMNADKDAAVTVRISNALGQSVVSRNALLQKGANVIVISELSALKAGMYVVELISEDGKQTQKIIKR